MGSCMLSPMTPEGLVNHSLPSYKMTSTPNCHDLIPARFSSNFILFKDISSALLPCGPTLAFFSCSHQHSPCEISPVPTPLSMCVALKSTAVVDFPPDLNISTSNCLWTGIVTCQYFKPSTSKIRLVPF